MSDFKEATVKTSRSDHDTGRRAGYGAGSGRSSQKLDVSPVSHGYDRGVAIDRMTEIPLTETRRRVWHDGAVFVDWHKFDDERSLPERRSDHARVGHTACWSGIARNRGIAGRTRFDVGAE